MAANLGFAYSETAVEVKETGVNVTVPNNPVAKLMYYLECVGSTLKLTELADFQKFTNYNQYASLTLDEQKVLVAFCELLSPSVLVGRVFFSSEAGDNTNKFYELSVASTQLAMAANSTAAVLIGDRNVQVTKIMTFKRSWLTTYYTTPLSELKDQLLRPSFSQLSVTQVRYTPSSETVTVTPRPASSSYASRDKRTSVVTFGAFMIVIAIADLGVASINLALRGLDFIGCGIWAGFLWGLICGAVMIDSGKNSWNYRKPAIGVGSTALILHAFHLAFLLAYGYLIGPGSLLVPINMAEVILAGSLTVLDLIAVLIAVADNCRDS